MWFFFFEKLSRKKDTTFRVESLYDSIEEDHFYLSPKEIIDRFYCLQLDVDEVHHVSGFI